MAVPPPRVCEDMWGLVFGNADASPSNPNICEHTHPPQRFESPPLRQSIKFFYNTPLCALCEYDILSTVFTYGEVAQLVEHHVRNVGVESSNLFFSTIRKEGSRFLWGLFCFLSLL